ncbi:MAG: hypothetical protein J5449_01030, partial [Oscillospiraceae bacterium]|nr:hypothetical protein [Oscillospiraceae bacterium]
AFMLCACRVRTTLVEPEPPDRGAGETAESAAPVRIEAYSEQLPAEEKPEEPRDNAPETEARSEPDEDTQRREYAADASGELTDEAETPLYAPAEEAENTPEANGGEPVNTEADGGELTATETVPADEAEQLGADEDGETADSAAQYYLTLLDSRLGSLFECKRLNVYWECAEDHLTVYKNSQEHDIILCAGAYDVSAKLLEENLTVDDGWVSRKNPDVVVKLAVGGALDAASAHGVCEELASRPGWEGVNAVREGRILVLSAQLLETPEGRLAAAVYLAKLMYPGQLEDVDADEALRELTGLSAGMFAYTA